MKKDFVLTLSRKEFLYLLSLVGSAGVLYNSDLFTHYYDSLDDLDVCVLNDTINDKLVSLL